MILGIEQNGSTTPIAKSVDCQMQMNNSVKEVSGSTQAKAREFVPGQYDWTLSTSGLYASGGSMVDLAELLKRGTTVAIQYETTAGGDIDIYSGYAIVTNISFAGSVRNKATYQIQLQGSGELNTQKRKVSTDGISVRFIMSGKNVTGVTNGVTIERTDYAYIADIFDGKQSNVYPTNSVYLDGELVPATVKGVQLICNGIKYDWTWYTNRYISIKSWRMPANMTEATMRIYYRYMRADVVLEWTIKTAGIMQDATEDGGGAVVPGIEEEAPGGGMVAG